MSKRFFHIVVSVLAVLAFFSCRKETSIERPRGPMTNGSFMADVGGSKWVAEDSLTSAAVLAGVISLNGTSSDHRQLIITLNDTVPGTYVLNQNSVSVALFDTGDSAGIYTTSQGTDTTQGGGTVTVTEIDTVNHTISGTFSFNVYRDGDGSKLQFTNGTFQGLPYASTLPPASDNDTLTATIDGNGWVAQSIDAGVANQLVITASNLNGTQSIGLSMPADVAPGQYPMDLTFTYFGAYVPSLNVWLASSEGTLEILEHDVTRRRIRGNFSFKAVDPADPLGTNNPPHQVTAGYFAVTYQ